MKLIFDSFFRANWSEEPVKVPRFVVLKKIRAIRADLHFKPINRGCPFIVGVYQNGVTVLGGQEYGSKYVKLIEQNQERWGQEVLRP